MTVGSFHLNWQLQNNREKPHWSGGIPQTHQKEAPHQGRTGRPPKFTKDTADFTASLDAVVFAVTDTGECFLQCTDRSKIIAELAVPSYCNTPETAL